MMKLNRFSAAFLLCTSMMSGTGYNGEILRNPIIVPAPVESVFVPQSFAEGDSIEVIIRGKFPNGCYSLGPSDAIVQLEQMKVNIVAKAYFSPGIACTLAILPYTQRVPIRADLPAGVYRVEVSGQLEVEAAELVVGESHASSTLRQKPKEDGLMYAAVHSVDLMKGGDGKPYVVLKGQHPFVFVGCVRLESVDTQVLEDNVVNIVPYARILNGPKCGGTTTPDNRFSEIIRLPDNLPTGSYMIHVKTLDEEHPVNRYVDWEG